MKNLVYYPDLPPIPEHLLVDVEKIVLERIANDPPHPNPLCQREMTVSLGGEKIVGGRYRGDEADESLQSWVRENIGDDLAPKARVRIASHGEQGYISVPHSDASRDWSLLYLLNLGGDNVETIFWQEQNQPLRRPNATFPQAYDTLIELERAKFPMRTWVLLDSLVVHSIENMTNLRIAIQVGFKDGSKTLQKIWPNRDWSKLQQPHSN
jgi:hypothetical protein